jgi:hypothetical protein
MAKYEETPEVLYWPLDHKPTVGNPFEFPPKWKYLKVETKLVRPKGWTEEKQLLVTGPESLSNQGEVVSLADPQ